jgi:peptide/nickel transport system permease protein
MSEGYGRLRTMGGAVRGRVFARVRPATWSTRVVSSTWRMPAFGTAVGLFLVATAVSVALLAPLLAPVDPWSTIARPLQAPGGAYRFGTDDLGRDLFAGVVHATRTSLMVAVAATSIASTIGVLLGALAGYYGGFWDDSLMRLTEFFQVMPRFFLALIAVALFGPSLVTITVVLGLTSWPMTSRLLRAQVLSVRRQEYVYAARALGAGTLFILWRHILPNSIGPIVVHSSLMIGQFMLTEASLSFLGLGDSRYMSWGYLLRNAQPFLRVAWWMSFFPGIAIALSVLGFNLLGDMIHERYARRRLAPVSGD